jgi:hypothetical protein
MIRTDLRCAPSQKKKKKENARGVTFGRIAMETWSPCNPVKAIPPPPSRWVLGSVVTESRKLSSPAD